MLGLSELAQVLVADLRSVAPKPPGRLQHIGAQAQIGCLLAGQFSACTAGGLCGRHFDIHAHYFVRIY